MNKCHHDDEEIRLLGVILQDCCTVALGVLDAYLEGGDYLHKEMVLRPTINFLSQIMGRPSLVVFMEKHHPHFKGIIEYLLSHKIDEFNHWDDSALRAAIKKAKKDIPEKW